MPISLKVFKSALGVGNGCVYAHSKQARGCFLKSLTIYFAVDLLKLKVTANLNPL